MADLQKSFLLKLDNEAHERLAAAAMRAGVSMQIYARDAIDAAAQEDEILGLAADAVAGYGEALICIRPTTPATPQSSGPEPARTPKVRYLAIRTLLRLARLHPLVARNDIFAWLAAYALLGLDDVTVKANAGAGAGARAIRRERRAGRSRDRRAARRVQRRGFSLGPPGPCPRMAGSAQAQR
jgi:predicted DNA-binding protein